MRYAVSISAIAWLLLPILAAQSRPDNRLSEDEVRVGYLFNFLKFAEWPALPGPASFVIGVLGADTLPMLEETLRGKAVHGRSIIVRRSEHPEELRTCSIVFISGGTAQRLQSRLKALTLPGVLTVGDTHDFAKRGGVIGLVAEDRRVKIEINTTALARSGVKISSRVLQLARLIEE